MAPASQKLEPPGISERFTRAPYKQSCPATSCGLREGLGGEKGQEPGPTDDRATTNRPVNYRDNNFTQFIDRIVLDRRVQTFLDRASFRQVTYSQEDAAV
jgi:hypothetical protein